MCVRRCARRPRGGRRPAGIYDGWQPSGLCITGWGENISSQEVEQAILQHGDLSEVAVHAVRSEVTEDDVKLTVIRVEGSQVTECDLFDWLKDRLPYFALPRYIEFRDALPISALGRVHKYKLRDEGCTPQTWDREVNDVEWDRR